MVHQKKLFLVVCLVLLITSKIQAKEVILLHHDRSTEFGLEQELEEAATVLTALRYYQEESLFLGLGLSPVFFPTYETEILEFLPYDLLLFRPFFLQTTLPTVSTTLFLEEGGLVAPSSYIREIGGVRVGFLGVLQGGYLGFSMGDTVLLTTGEALRIRPRVDLLVALTNLPAEEALQLLLDIPELDLVFCARSEGDPDFFEVANRYVVPSGSALGMVKMIANSQGTWDYHVSAFSFAYHSLHLCSSFLDKPITRLTQPLKRSTSQGTPLGNLVADALQLGFSTDVALVPSSLIRGSVLPGEITLRRIWSLLPEKQEIRVERLLGEDLKELLAKNMQEYGAPYGDVFQLAGVEIALDHTNAILEIYVQGVPLDPKKEYLVAMPSLEGNTNRTLRDVVFLHWVDTIVYPEESRVYHIP